MQGSLDNLWDSLDSRVDRRQWNPSCTSDSIVQELYLRACRKMLEFLQFHVRMLFSSMKMAFDAFQAAATISLTSIDQMLANAVH